MNEWYLQFLCPDQSRIGNLSDRVSGVNWNFSGVDWQNQSARLIWLGAAVGPPLRVRDWQRGLPKEVPELELQAKTASTAPRQATIRIHFHKYSPSLPLHPRRQTPGPDVGSPCQTQVWYVTLLHARSTSSLPQSLSLTVNFPHQKGAGAGALEETLGRLSKKAGVRATIILDRASGAILKTSGQVGSIRKTKAPGSSSVPAVGPFTGEANGNASTTPSQDEGAEELASMVWNFVSTAGSLVQELDTEVNSSWLAGADQHSRLAADRQLAG